MRRAQARESCPGKRNSRTSPRVAVAPGPIALGTLVPAGDSGPTTWKRPVDIVALAPIALLIVAFYFLLIRPQKARQRQQAQMVAALAPGAQVMTTAGMMGTVAVVADDEISLEISPGVFVRMVPAAVAKVVEPAPTIDAENEPESGSEGA